MGDTLVVGLVASELSVDSASKGGRHQPRSKVEVGEERKVDVLVGRVRVLMAVKVDDADGTVRLTENLEDGEDDGVVSAEGDNLGMVLSVLGEGRTRQLRLGDGAGEDGTVGCRRWSGSV